MISSRYFHSLAKEYNEYTLKLTPKAVHYKPRLLVYYSIATYMACIKCTYILNDVQKSVQ